MQPTRPAPSLAPQTNTPFGRKLGYYLLGIAIGLMVVGMIVTTRQQFLAQRTAEGPPPSAPDRTR